jgi:haloacetate dehalogenase
MDNLHEAQALAETIGLPKELWQIRSRIGDLHEQRGEDGQASYSPCLHNPETIHATCEDYRAAATLDFEKERH